MSYNTIAELKKHETQCKYHHIPFLEENNHKCIAHDLNFLSKKAYFYHLKAIHENDTAWIY